MELYQALQIRKTIRDFEQINGLPRTIEEPVLKRIFEAGFYAPTNDHMRDWHFMLLNNLEERNQLIKSVLKPTSEKRAEFIINQWGLKDPDQRKMYLEGIPRQFSMLNSCGCLILPFYRQDNPLLKPKDLSALNYFVSIWLCIENMINAAAAEGIFGVVRIPGEEERKIMKTSTGAPSNYECPCWLALGYPAADARRADQVKLDITSRLHENKW